MRIGVDAHVVGRRQTGNERVFVNLLRSLPRVCEHEILAYFTEPAAAQTWRTNGSGVQVRMLRPTNPLVRIPVSMPVLAKRDRLDAMLCHTNVPPLSPCPVVSLIHDIAFVRYPQYFSRYQRTYMNLTVPASMRWADAVVAVSQFTKDEVVAVYGIPPGRITVAHNAVDEVFGDPPTEPVIEPPFFLAAGNLQPRKNLHTLVTAFRELLARRTDLPERLVLAGPTALDSAPLLNEAADLVQTGRVVLPGYLSDHDLASLCRVATAFAYPSVYEGFGLPPLEAMAAGAPVLVADIPVMREVVGNAGLRLPADDPAAWRAALERLLDDSGFRDELIERGRAHAASFSWDAQAATIVRLIERMVEASPRRRRVKP